MTGRRIIIVLAAGIVHRLQSLVWVLVGVFLVAVFVALNFAVAFGEDSAVGRLVETLTVHEKGLGVGCEARTRILDDFMKGMAWRLQGAELLFTAGLANLFVGLDEVEVNLLGHYAR